MKSIFLIFMGMCLGAGVMMIFLLEESPFEAPPSEPVYLAPPTITQAAPAEAPQITPPVLKLEPPTLAPNLKRPKSPPKPIVQPEVIEAKVEAPQTFVSPPTLPEPKVEEEPRKVLFYPLQKIHQYHEDKAYQETLTYFDETDWAQFKELAIAYRLAAVVELSKTYIEKEKYSEAIFLLEHQLNIDSDAPKAYHLLAQALTSQGEIEAAFRRLREGHVVVEDREEAELLLKIQVDMALQHLDFLQKNEHWLELIAYVDKDPVQGHDDYYFFKLAAAQAYLQLYELDKAEEQLVLAEFDPNLSPHIQKVRKEIEALRKELEAQIEEEHDSELIKIPIRVRGDSIYVDVTVNKTHNIVLLLDTGASITHLSLSTQQAIGSAGYEEQGERIFITASGKMKAPVGTIELLTMGEAGVSHLMVAFSDIFSKDSGVDGLLGMNFLKFYNFSFNFDEGFLELKPKDS